MRKALAAFAALAVIALLGWLALDVGGPDTRSSPTTPAASPQEQAPVAPPREAAPRATRRDAAAQGGIDGTPTAAGAPAAAHVTAMRLGPPRDPATWTRRRVQTLATPPRDVPDAETDSNASGTFALDGLRAGLHRVLATFTDGRRAAAVVDLASDTARARVFLSAPEGTLTLRGRAVHGDGSPYAGWIRVHGSTGGIESAAWVRTGAAGAFSFAGLLPGRTYLFTADAAATRTVGVSVELPRDGEFVFVVDREAAQRKGRVVAAADGAPIAGASVTVRSGSSRTGEVELNLVAGGDGRFEGRWAARAAVWASAPGFARTLVQDDGKADEVVVRLERGAAVEGRVLRKDDGSPVAGAKVRARPAGDRGGGLEATTVSGADGRYRLEDLAAGDFDVYVRGGGWVSPDLAAVRRGGFDPFAVQVAAGATATVELRAEPAARAEGRVLDASGAPVAAMSVGATPSAHFDGFPWGSTSAPSGADGAFALEDLLPGIEHTFAAWPTQGLPKRSAPVLTEGGKTARVEIRLDTPRHLDVSVLAEGTLTPVAGAAISVTQDGDRATTRELWTTGADGRADVFPVPGGKIGVRAKAPGYVAPKGDAIAKEVDATHLSVVVGLVPAKPIAGRVVVPAGVSVDDVGISVRSEPAGGGAPRMQENAYPAADGTFRLDTLADDTYRLEAFVAGDSSLRGSVVARSGDENVVLTIGPAESGGAALRVRVLDASGKPIPSAVLSFGQMSESAASIGAAVVRDGVANLTVRPDLPRRSIEVARPTPPAGAATSPGAALVDVPDPPPAEFEIRLPDERRITGRVLGPDGAGVAGVRVVAQPTAGLFGMAGYRQESQAHGTGTSDATGAFEVGRLGELRYRLIFAVPPAFAPPPEMEVAAGSTGVEVRLTGGRDATVAVLDADGRPVASCVVTATPERAARTGRPELIVEAARSATTASDGRAKLRSLDGAVQYWLELTPPPGREDLVRAEAIRWTPHDIEVRLERGFVVAGIVCDGSGRVLDGAMVLYATGESRVGAPVRVGADGRFRITGLRTGQVVRLRAIAGPGLLIYPSMDRDVVEARAGAEDVRLVADVRATLTIRIEGVPSGPPLRWQMTRSKGVADGATSTSQSGSVPPDGVLKLMGLDPARTYCFVVGPTAAGLYALSGDIPTGGEEVVLRMTQGEPVTGRVVLPAGVEASEVSVYASGDGWSDRTTPAADGSFRFPGLPPGDCSVGAHVSRNGKSAWQKFLQSAPRSDVVLELEAVR